MVNTHDCSACDSASPQATISELNLKIPMRRRAASLEERFLTVQVKHSDADVTIRCRKYPTGERVQFYCHRSVLAQKSLYFREKNSFERLAELPCAAFVTSNSCGSAHLPSGVASGVAGNGDSSRCTAQYARSHEFSGDSLQSESRENRAALEEFLLDDYDDDVVYEVLRYIYCGTFCPPVGFSRRFPMLLSLIDYLGLCQQNPAPIWSVYDNNNWGCTQKEGPSVAQDDEDDEGGMLSDRALTDYLKNTPIDKLKDLLQHSEVFGSPHHGRGGLGFSLRTELIERLVKLRSEDMTMDTLGGDLYHRMTRAGDTPSMGPVPAIRKVLPVPVFVRRFDIGTTLEKRHINPSETLCESLQLPSKSLLWYVGKTRSQMVPLDMTLEEFRCTLLSSEDTSNNRAWLAPQYFVVEPQLFADIFNCCFRRALLRPVDDEFVKELQWRLESLEYETRTRSVVCEQRRLLWKTTRKQIAELTSSEDVRIESVGDSDPVDGFAFNVVGVERTGSTHTGPDESPPWSPLPPAHIHAFASDAPMDTGDALSPQHSNNDAPLLTEPRALSGDGEEERGAPTRAVEYWCGGANPEMDAAPGKTMRQRGTRNYGSLSAPDGTSAGENGVDVQRGTQNMTNVPDMVCPWKKIRLVNLDMQYAENVIPPCVSLEVEQEGGTQLTIQLFVVSCGTIPFNGLLFTLAIEEYATLREVAYSRSTRRSHLDSSFKAFAKITPAPGLPGVCPRSGFVRSLLVGASLAHLCFSLQRALKQET